MKIEFVRRENGPERLICEAELVFEASDGPLEDLKLVGLSLWQGADGEIYVTFPSRATGASTDRRYFDYIREVGPRTLSPSKAFKRYVVKAYREWSAGESSC